MRFDLRNPYFFLNLFLSYLLLFPLTSWAQNQQDKNPQKEKENQINGDIQLLAKESVRQISASSTARGYYMDSLNKLVRWRVWGSEPTDVINSWFYFGLDRLHYIKKITFQPGDERDPSYYQKCARPARVRINADRQDERMFKLNDRRYHQEITFNPPLATRNIKLSFPEVYGKSELGGVCVSVVEIWTIQDPLKALPEIKNQLTKAIDAIKHPMTRPDAIKKLRLLGPIVTQPLINMIPSSNLDIQTAILDVLVDTADASQTDQIKSLYAHIQSADLNFKLQWTLASLGDEVALDLMADQINGSAPTEIALRYEALARSGHEKYLDLVLKGMVKNSEIAERIMPHFKNFLNAYETLIQKFKEANTTEKPFYLVALAANDAQRAINEINDAFFQEKDEEMKAAAIRSYMHIPDTKIKKMIIDQFDSPFVSVRMAVADYLSAYAKEEEIKILETLSNDRSQRVRASSMKGLALFVSKTQSLLEKNALTGPDELTAYTAAKSWLENTMSDDLSVPQILINSQYEKVQTLGIQRLLDLDQMACPLLISSFIKREQYAELIANALIDQWHTCEVPFAAKKSEIISQQSAYLNYLQLIAKGKLQSQIADVDALLVPVDQLNESFLHSPKGALFLKALSIYGAIQKPEPTIEKLIPYLEVQNIALSEVLIQALKGLAGAYNEKVIALAKKEIQMHLPYAHLERQKILVAYLEWIGQSQVNELLPLLAQAFIIWKRSLEFNQIRLATIKTVIQLKGLDRIGTLMEGVLDLSPEIQEISKEALGKSKVKKIRDYDDLSKD